MKRAPLLLPLVVLLFAGSAYAADDEDGAVCRDSYEQAQVKMKPATDGRSELVRARELLRTCMRSGCKDWMVSDCSKWLNEVEARIPTVVFSARTTAGRDLTDTTVSDAEGEGEVLASRIDGRAIEMEPGEHTFVFVTADGERLEKRVLVREGEKAQSIAALFEIPGETAPVFAGTGTPLTAAPEREPAPANPLKLAGYGVAGAGLVGLGLGTFFGVRAIVKKSEANCDADQYCDKGPKDQALSSANVATVAFVAGATLLAGGLGMVLFAPSPKGRPAVRAYLTGQGIGVHGTW